MYGSIYSNPKEIKSLNKWRNRFSIEHLVYERSAMVLRYVLKAFDSNETESVVDT